MGETRPATCRFPFLVKIVLLTSRVDSSPYHSASAGRHCWWFCRVFVALERVLRLLDCKKSLQIRFREATVHGSLVPDSWRSRNDIEAV